MNKCYSINEENFNLDGIGEVIDALMSSDSDEESILGLHYWEGDAYPILHKHIIGESDIKCFLETLDEQIYEFIEDPDSVYSAVPKEAVTELKDLVLAWADKHVTEGKYYRVVNVQQKVITLDDLE